MSLQQMYHVNTHVFNDDFSGLSWAPGVSGVLFVHADWCGHCQNMMIAINAAAVAVHSDQSGMIIAINETAVSTEAKQTLQINGFPTLLLFDENGTFTGPHQGARTEASLIAAASGN